MIRLSNCREGDPRVAPTVLGVAEGETSLAPTDSSCGGVFLHIVGVELRPEFIQQRLHFSVGVVQLIFRRLLAE